MIKAFLFDWGGVMSAGGRGGELDARLAERLDMSPKDVWTVFRPAWEAYSRGKIDEPTLWRQLEAGYGQTIPETKRNIWNEWSNMSILPQMQQLVTDLKTRGYTVGLLSNTIPNTAEDIRSHGGYDLFDFLVLSYEVGFAKPDEAIYKLALEKLPDVEPSEVVFVDDQERCLEPARALGIRTVLSVTPEQVVADIRHFIT